ncbi:hypothetical protein ACE939_10925 [Aquimarina sp. W85]|uniref:hypothetical protein n=1 Tax=Aquimarina rhodophyticola TaxID=3342246 RepID=UPI00366BE4B6
MRYYCFTFLLLCSILPIVAQTKSQAILSVQKEAHSLHKIDSLETVRKKLLIEFYTFRITELLTKLPFTPQIYKETVMDAMKNKVSLDQHNSKYFRVFENKNALKAKQIAERFPTYSVIDYTTITNVLHIEEVIKKMKIGVKGNF